MFDKAIPDNLKKYELDILAGFAAARRRKIEYSQAWGYPEKPPAGPAAFAVLEKSIERPIQEKPGITSSDLKCPGPASMQKIKILPLVGMAAARRGDGGAWRAWSLAKNLDKTGQGAIPLVELELLARELDIHKKTWRRWLAAARRLTLVRDRMRGDGWIVLAGQAWAAVLLGCDYLGPRPASIAAGDLISEGWRAFIWAAYEQTHHERPISRRKQEQLTGVPERTQRAYDSQVGVDRRPNYSLSDRPGDNLAAVAEFEDRPGLFKYYDKKRRRWWCAWRLPDCRSTTAAESLQRGRSKKIAKQIKRLSYKRINGLSILGQAESYDAGSVATVRLFHRTGRQARAAIRKLDKTGSKQPNELYLFKQAGRSCDFWQPLPLGGIAA